MLSNNERTPQVIRNAMLKFCIDDDPENYTLSQVLPDKGMIYIVLHVIIFNKIYFLLFTFQKWFYQ